MTSRDAGAISSSISSPTEPSPMPTLSPAPSLTPSPVSTTSDNSNHRPFAGRLLSAVSSFHCRVKFTEFDAGVLGSELPIGPGGGGVAAVLPSLDVALQRRPVTHPVRQVAAEGAPLDLGHVQPRA